MGQPFDREYQNVELRERILGCLFGGAIGDAMGSRWEGSPAGFQLDDTLPWRLTDDTELTLATCEAIVDRGVVDPAAIAAHFASGLSQRRYAGLGAATLKALTELLHGGHWASVGRKGEFAAGNGAAMRIAPLAFLLDPGVENDRVLIRDVARITHHHDEAYSGALAVILAIRHLRHGDPDQFFDSMVESLPDTVLRDRLRQLQDIAPLTIAQVAQTFGSGGHAVASIPLALFASLRMFRRDFLGPMRELIACGGDTDTNASIAGQIAGSALGFRGIPEALIDRLPDRHRIQDVASQFAEFCVQRDATAK